MRSTTLVFWRAAALTAALMLCTFGPGRATLAAADPSGADIIDKAEELLRRAAEDGAAEVQRSISANINMVMSTRPATSFKVRNAIRAGQNAVNATARRVTEDFEIRLTEAIDDLLAAGAPIIDVSRLFDKFDVEVADKIRELRLQGVRDLASLSYHGRRTSSVRGTLVGRYELFVSQPENGRDLVKLGEVSLGESQMVRGPISTQAAEEFFEVSIDTLPRVTVLRAVRWLYRGGILIVTADDSQGQNFVRVDQDTFTLTGVDLLPERLRLALERKLADSPDVRGNIDGADGFFQSLTYVFRRLPDDR